MLARACEPGKEEQVELLRTDGDFSLGELGSLGWVSLGVCFVCFRSHLLSGHVLSEIVGAVEGLLAAFVSADIGLLGLVAQFMASTVFRAGENLSPVRNPS